jgi:carbamoylphosphate synthase large subunit
MIKVLITPAGTEIGREIFSSLRHEKSVELVLAGADYDNHARYIGHEYFLLRGVNEPGWLEDLQAFVRLHAIDFIFPAHDDVLLAYAMHQDEIAAKIIAPPREACLITRSKQRTYHKVSDLIPVPKCYQSIEDIDIWPVFVKPDCGQGSQGALKIADKVTLEKHLASNPGLLICEYLPGEEYTVDCFTQTGKGVLFCQARTRERVRAGISMASRTIEIPGIAELAESLSQRLNLLGSWFFQIKRAKNGTLSLLEIAPRIAGTMALNRVRGVNFPLLSLYEHRDIPVSINALNGEFKISRALVNRFKTDINYNSVYIDFDDTLVVHNQLCLPLISFIFQCINKKIPCILITRHAGDIHRSLKQWRINTLFDEVIHLRQNEKKSDYIVDRDAIFIDDSFRERRDVSEIRGIPVFDLSMIDLLLEE